MSALVLGRSSSSVREGLFLPPWKVVEDPEGKTFGPINGTTTVLVVGSTSTLGTDSLPGVFGSQGCMRGCCRR